MTFLVRSFVSGFLLLQLAAGVWPDEEALRLRSREHRIPFRYSNGLIYIPARVNGQKVTLLLDTGTVQTSFSLKIAPAKTTDSKIKVNMARGSMLAFRTPVDFTIGSPDLKEHRCSFSQNVVVGDFTFEGAEGAIGLDVLRSFKGATFDFQNSVLVLEDL